MSYKVILEVGVREYTLVTNPDVSAEDLAHYLHAVMKTDYNLLQVHTETRAEDSVFIPKEKVDKIRIVRVD